MKNINYLNKQKEIGQWGHIVQDKIKVIKKYGGKKILDIGCASGDYVIYLNQHGFDAVGCDVMKDIQWARYPNTFKIGNIYKIPYKNKSIDTILAFEILEHLDNLSLALKEISRVAIKNLIISVPNCELPEVFTASGLSFCHHIDKTHINRFTEKEIRALLKKNGYKVIFFKYISPIRPEILFLYCWHIPLKIANFMGKVISKLPLSKKIYSDLLIVATIKN